MLFERFNTPEELFSFKLGSALTMERKLVETLEQLEEEAQRGEIKQALAQHRQQTIQHCRNVEECFRLLGEEVDDSPCPVIDAMAAEGKATIKKTEDGLVDNVVLSSAIESEHHELAVYESLIIQAQARGNSEVVSLLRRNLEEENQALEIARSALTDISRADAAVGGAARA
ncbi:MAG TPA: DUF892 family protein [Solirubrobacteraceae bacterium]